MMRRNKMLIEKLLAMIRVLDKRVKKLEEANNYFTKVENIKDVRRVEG